MTNNKGFTLIEMLITMVLVIVVIMITGTAFESILKNSGRLISSEESNIEGVVGLEMFRHDLQQMGYGIPDAFQLPINYPEATVAPANLLNDGHGTASAGDIPRAVVSLDAMSGYATGNTYNVLTGTDYLAVKATTVGRNKASKKWTYLRYSGAAGAPSELAPNTWSNPEDNFKQSDKVIVLKRSFTDTGTTNTLIYNNNNTGVATIYWSSTPTVLMSDNFNPGSTDPTYYLYGVDDGALGMPFNRADFFVARPSTASSIPTTCAYKTGILYKATVNHADGRLNYMPLLDCVADMQVVFGWDVNSDGVITESSAYSDTASEISVSGTASNAAIQAIMIDANEIRKKLKYIKVYIMAQDGRRDASYKNTDILMNNTYSVVVGDANTRDINTSTSLSNSASNVSITKGYTAAELASKDWLNYRWKVYRIVVKPKNLSN